MAQADGRQRLVAVGNLRSMAEVWQVQIAAPSKEMATELVGAFRGDELVNLGRREVLLLGALLRKRGKIVTKTELLDAAWPDQSVVEANLSVQIANLRKSLGTSPNWITTVERVGYRFRDLAATDHRASLGRTSALPSLAVLYACWRELP